MPEGDSPPIKSDINGAVPKNDPYTAFINAVIIQKDSGRDPITIAKTFLTQYPDLAARAEDNKFLFQALQQKSITDSAVTTPQAPDVNERTKTQEWVEILKTKGVGFITGKFAPEWFDGVDKGGDFHQRGFFSSRDALREGFIETSTPGAELGKNVYSTYDLYNSQCDTNYVIATASFDRNSALGKELNLDENQNWRGIVYSMWGHKEYTPGSRGHHTPLRFYMYLPEQQAGALLGDINKTPDLIDDVFKNIYANELQRGLNRVRVPKLKIFELPTNNITHEQEVRMSKQVHSLPPLSFSTPVGEFPG